MFSAVFGSEYNVSRFGGPDRYEFLEWEDWLVQCRSVTRASFTNAPKDLTRRAVTPRRCYQEALERQTGDHMINPRVHHSVAETLEAMRGYSDALKHERLSRAG